VYCYDHIRIHYRKEKNIPIKKNRKQQKRKIYTTETTGNVLNLACHLEDFHWRFQFGFPPLTIPEMIPKMGRSRKIEIVLEIVLEIHVSSVAYAIA
jgi:hypothetical protein